MGFDISIEEKIARWHETNTPNGDPVELVFERTIEEVTKILLPSQKTPIPAATILGQMDLGFLEPVLSTSLIISRFPRRILVHFPDPILCESEFETYSKITFPS